MFAAMVSRLFKESSAERPHVRNMVPCIGGIQLTRYLLRDLCPNLRKSQLVEFVLEIGNKLFEEIELVRWGIGVVKKLKNGKC